MTLAREASLAVLCQAVLDLVGPEAAAARPVRGRLAEIDPAARAAADRARAATGFAPPDLTQPHESIFSMVHRDSDRSPLLLLPQELSLRPAYPLQDRPDARTLRTAAAALRARLAADLSVLPPEPNALLFVLEKYAWAVSAGAPGLAFADLARITAAAAGALAHGTDRLLLVGGDLSGVQRFIYTISAKGALRSLRARSFFLELIAEEAARRLLDGLGLTRANLVYLGAGHLYLLTPDTPRARDCIQSVHAELNQWLLGELGGRVYLAMGCSEFDLAALAPGSEAVPEIWRLVSQQLRQDKSRKFHQAALHPGFWEPRPLGRAACSVCQQETDEPEPLDRDPDEEEVLACPLCLSVARAGGRLPRTRYLVAAATEGADLVIAGTGYHFCDSAAAVAQIPERRAVMALNALKADALAIGEDPYPVWLGTYALKSAQGDGMITFAELAERSTGKPLLGVLRMDVDRLGQLFSGGLPEGCRDFYRTAGLSGALTRFFKLHLNSICAGDLGKGLEPLRLTVAAGPRPVVVVYSGGDDLFITGAWDQTLALAFDIRSAFHRFTGGRLTLSGGMVAADYHQPIHRLAEMAAEAEEAAKQNRGPDGQDRDSIAPLFTGSPTPRVTPHRRKAALKWDEALALIEGFVKPALGPLGLPDRPGTRIPRRILYGLLGLVDYWEEHGPLYLPRLAYLLTRVDKELSRDPVWEAWRKFVIEYPAAMAPFAPFVQWIDLIGRGGTANE